LPSLPGTNVEDAILRSPSISQHDVRRFSQHPQWPRPNLAIAVR
jgi:hypothetical protein